MESGFSLIDAAAQKAGSRYKLALRLGESESFLSKVAAGKKPMPASLAARMAVIAGLDARRAALEAVVSHEKNREKQIALAAALGVEPPPESENGTGTAVKLAWGFRTTGNKIARLFRPSKTNERSRLTGFFGLVF